MRNNRFPYVSPTFFFVDYFDYSSNSDGFLDEVEALEFDIERFLEESQEKERQRLESELERIEEELERRDQLHEEFVDELESKMNRYVDRLTHLHSLTFVSKPEEQEELKSKIEEFYQELRREKRDHWRDRQKLEKERRVLLRKIEELDDDLLSDLL